MNGVSPENLVLIGKIIRPHGVEGCLRILSYAESEKTFLDAGTVIICSENGETNKHRVISLKPHHRIFLLSLEGVDTPEAAEAYRNAAIFIQKGAIKACCHFYYRGPGTICSPFFMFYCAIAFDYSICFCSIFWGNSHFDN